MDERRRGQAADAGSNGLFIELESPAKRAIVITQLTRPLITGSRLPLIRKVSLISLRVSAGAEGRWPVVQSPVMGAF